MIARAALPSGTARGPDRASWLDPESESDDPVARPRPGGFFTSVGEFFSSIFGGGNNNDNDDNDRSLSPVENILS